MDDNLGCWPDHLHCDHRDYIGKDVTLNGYPAKIVKDQDGHGRISPLDPDLTSIPFSWIAIFNICDNHSGEFMAGFTVVEHDH